MAALLYLVILPLISFQICCGATPWQIMTTGSHIRGEDHDKIVLLSPDTTFSCGLYELGTNALTFSIWYTNSTAERTVVWTANPYSPESGYSPVNKYGSRLSLNHDGNLILTDTNGTTVWESKTSSGKHSTVTLLDSGNLVINDSSNNMVWQSFDSPTDTLLPGQNLMIQEAAPTQYTGNSFSLINSKIRAICFIARALLRVIAEACGPAALASLSRIADAVVPGERALHVGRRRGTAPPAGVSGCH